MCYSLSDPGLGNTAKKKKISVSIFQTIYNKKKIYIYKNATDLKRLKCIFNQNLYLQTLAAECLPFRVKINQFRLDTF